MTTIHAHSPLAVPALRPERPTARTAKVATVAATASVPPITVLHLSATGPLEPSGWTISDYVVTVPNGIPLYAMTAGALAVGGGALARSLQSRTATGVLRLLLVIWAGAVLATAVFPTNMPGTPENASSVIHLVAGAVVFASLPAAGLLLARVLRRAGQAELTVALTMTSAIGAVLSTALIANRLPAVVGMPELMLPPGILQRAAGAVQILLLALAATAVLRSARATAR
jgi:hypothetical protein